MCCLAGRRGSVMQRIGARPPGRKQATLVPLAMNWNGRSYGMEAARCDYSRCICICSRTVNRALRYREFFRGANAAA